MPRTDLYIFFRFPFRTGYINNLKIDFGRAPVRFTRHVVSRLRNTEGPFMQDVTMIFFTAVFFGLAFLYVKACQKLR